MKFRLGALAGLVALLLLPAPFGQAAEPIQPGARMISPAGCTLNFVFRDQNHTYIGTAGHCTDEVGQSVGMAGGEIGRVAFRILEDADDFALIRLNRSVLSRVRPDMLGFEGPTGVTEFGDAEVGDAVHLYGHGMFFDTSEGTRPRSGVLTGSDSEEWRAALPAIFGDSGGPVLHGPTGTALGVISGIAFDPSKPHTVLGTTVERALELLAEAGLPVRLVTSS